MPHPAPVSAMPACHGSWGCRGPPDPASERFAQPRGAGDGGKLLTGRDIVIAALLGAEEFAFATAPLVVLGCDMMRVCNLDTCPVGIATQNPCLRGRFTGKPEYIQNLMRFLAMEVREWMARIGVTRFDDLVGHAELLRQSDIAFSDKANTVDLSGLLYQPKVTDRAGERTFTQPQQHRLEKTFDTGVLLPLCRDAIETGRPVAHRLGIQNRHRTVGCALSGRSCGSGGRRGCRKGLSPCGSMVRRGRASAPSAPPALPWS